MKVFERLIWGGVFSEKAELRLKLHDDEFTGAHSNKKEELEILGKVVGDESQFLQHIVFQETRGAISYYYKLVKSVTQELTIL